MIRDRNKAIDIGERSVWRGGRLERFYYIYIYIYLTCFAVNGMWHCRGEVGNYVVRHIQCVDYGSTIAVL